MVVSELRGEKIDIIPYNDEPARFVAKALSPARVREVLVDDEAKQATVIVPDDQLSLAIGREGQNARLAARLTGWRIDIKSETEYASEDHSGGDEGEDEVGDGRCHAILVNGRRCPNSSIPGSRYCGLFAHQALVDYDTDNVAVLTADDEDEDEDDHDGAESAEVDSDEAVAVEVESEDLEEGSLAADDELEPAVESFPPNGNAEQAETVESAGPPTGEAEDS
jgi:N utilization substance protein A